VGGGGRKERSISKSEIIRLSFIESNDAPMTQSHGDVEQRRALVRNCKKTVEARRGASFDGCVPVGGLFD
jgi:hypothetical protein